MKDCYYVPVASRNLIFVSVLAQEGLKLVSIKTCSIYLRNKLIARGLDSLYHLHVDRKSTRLNSSHSGESRMPSSA